MKFLFIVLMASVPMFSSAKAKTNTMTEKHCNIAGQWRQTSLDKNFLCSPENQPLPSPEVRQLFEKAAVSVESFFQRTFPRSVDIFLFANRSSADEYWKNLFKDQKFSSPCWMVASGVAQQLAMLSTEAWANEACDHSSTDLTAVKLLIAHELVHSFHGQHNPSPEFDGLDSIGWFVEGLAVLASGQLDDRRIQDAQQALAQWQPANLGEIWSGKYRYGLAGTLVKYIDEKRGLRGLLQMLTYTEQEQFLKDLSLSEPQLIAEWREWVLNQKPTLYQHHPKLNQQNLKSVGWRWN